MSDNPISCSIDFEQNGIHHGFLRQPYSNDDSAWGTIMTPICVIKNGQGPTALLTGGNHGDEYEGPIALFDLAETTELTSIQGRVIIVPAMNYPAFQAGCRVSPIDGVNLNRAFPGRPDGSITEIIADYFGRTLLPLADFVLDIHSGGKTLDFLPFAACHELEDKAQEARCEAAMRAFGAPIMLKLLEIDSGGMYDTLAEQLGKVFVSTELGGGGTTRVETMAVARRGVRNFLRHADIMEGELTPAPADARFMDMPNASCYLFAEHNGLLEPMVELGDRVQQGELVLRIHNTDRTALPPHDYHAPRDGIVIGRSVPSMVKMGDCLNVIAQVVT